MPEATSEAFVLHFKASVSRDPRGKFKAETGDFPGIVSTGGSQEEALAALESAILSHLSTSAALALEAVHEERDGAIPYAVAAAGPRLYVATSLDAILISEAGAKGAWRRVPVTQQESGIFQVFEGEAAEDPFGAAPDSQTQVYSLASFAAEGGAPSMFAGTDLKGLVYVNESADDWRPAFSTAEERVHALAGFGAHLYAGTSSSGRIYRWDGKAAEMVHQAAQLGITALGVHDGRLYAGTYPDGLILRSEDGELWEIVCRTGQKLVNQFRSAPHGMFAACSHPAGGAIFRSADGYDWERCFFSDRDPNVFAVESFGGRLYAGTGESGRLYASRDGLEWEVALQSPEASLRGLASHAGRLYVFCERRAIVYRTASTESPAPALKDITVAQLTSSRAFLEWATDAPCAVTVRYGEGPVRDRTVDNPTLSRRHRVALDGLRAGTRYSFMITARSAEGAEAVHLAEDGFTTPVVTGPALSSPTHPDEERWYPSRDIEVRWEAVPGAAKYVVRVSPQRITHLTAADLAVADRLFHASADGDGAWWVAVAAVDEAGNVGDASTRAFRCDTSVAVPAVSSPTHPDGAKWSASPAVEVEAAGTDAASGVEGFLFAIGRVGEAWEHLAFQSAPPPGEGEHGARWALPRLPDGAWEIYVRMRDRAGNESAPATFRVQLDTTPPTVALDALPSVVRAGEVELRWLTRDERSGVARISIQQRRATARPGSAPADAAAGDWETVYEGKGTAVKLDGRDGESWAYRVVAEDRAGNRAAAESHASVLFDGSAPEPVTVLEATSLGGGDVVLRWGTVADRYSEVVRYHIYRSAQAGKLGMKVGSVPASIQEYVDEGIGLAHGSRSWYRVAAEDGVGNIQTDGPDVAGICDKEAVPPVIRSSTHQPEQWTTLAEAELDWDKPADDTGVREYLWRLDRQPASNLIKGVDAALPAPPLRIPHLMDGLWYVHVATVDGAGNVSPAAHYPLRVVTRPPHARLKPLPTIVNSRKVRLEWEGEEGVVAVDIGVREGGAQAWKVVAERAEGKGREVAVEGEGVFEFSVRALDTFGRSGAWEEGQVTLVDTTPPLEVPSVEATPLPGGRIRVTWEPSWDELSGLAGYRVLRSRQGAKTGKAAKDAKDAALEVIAEVPATEDPVVVDECETVPDGARFTYTVWPLDTAGNVLEQGPAAEAVCDRTAPTPKLVAKTHPDPARFYGTRRLEVIWDAPEDPTGLKGLVVELNATGSTVPNPDTLPPRTDRTLTFDLREDGRWYLHARTVDGAGNASETVHLLVQVDTRVDPPTASFAQDPFLEWEASKKVTVMMKAPEDLSGIVAYWHILDGLPATVPDRLAAKRSTSPSIKAEPKSEGVWFLHVCAEDGAGNLSAPVHLQMRLTKGLPMPHITKSSHPEGLWSRTREVEVSWEPVEGERISYLYWLAPKRQEEPPAGAMRSEKSSLKLNVEEGIAYLHLCAADELGRRSAAAAYQLRVDATAPDLTVYSPSHAKGRWSARHRVQYAIESEDRHSGIARVELALTPAGREPDVWELALGTEGEREVPSEGLWSLWARAADLAGNLSPLARWDIQVDLAAPPPGVGSMTHPEGIWVNTLTAELMLFPGEDLAGIAEYSVAVFAAGEEVPAEPPADALRTPEEAATLTLPGDGRWTVAVWTRDVAGNVSPPARAALLADTMAAPPTGFVVEPTGEGGWIRSHGLHVWWKHPEEASGEPLGYLWTLDREAATVPDPDAANFAALAELDLGWVPDGINWLHVRTRDMAGNVSETVHLKLAVDGDAPSLTLTCPEAGKGGWMKGRHVTVHAAGEDPVSGVTGFFWTLTAEGEPAPDPSTGRWKEEPEWTVEIPHDGTWILAVAALDGAGNLSEPSRVTIGVDAEAAPPADAASPSHPEADRWYPGREIRVEWTTPMDASGITGARWALQPAGAPAGDPKGWQRVAASPLVVTAPGDGAWTVSLATEDAVGNVSAPVTVSVRVDSDVAPPRLVSPTHPDPAVWYAEGAVTLDVEAADSGSGIAEVLLGAAQGADPAPGSLKPIEGRSASLKLERGEWRVHAVAVDRAGNRSAPAARVIRIDPAMRAPLVTCESHPDPARWYPNSDIRVSVMAAGAKSFLWVLDDQPGTKPAAPAAAHAAAGPLRVSADHSGEWWLHIAAAPEGGGPASEAAHVQIRIDSTAPPAPVVRSPSHAPAPRRTRGRDVIVEWDEPQDVSGIKNYAWALTRPSMLGTKTGKSGTTTQRRVTLPGVDPGVWDVAVTATDGAGQTGAPGKYQLTVSDTQDLYVIVRSESWRVALPNIEVELRDPGKSVKRLKTGNGGEAWFKEQQYGRHQLQVALPKPNAPLEFEGVDLEEGESVMRMEVSLAGCAWMICRDQLRLWVPKMWLEGGRIELLGEKDKAISVHLLKDLPKKGPFLECPLPPTLLQGAFQLLGGPLAKLQWQSLPFTRLPLS